MSKLKVLPDKVLILLPDKSVITEVGNHKVKLYGVSYEEPVRDRGKVVAVGDKSKKDGIKKGVQVLFSTQHGTDLKMNGQDYVLIKPENITGIIENEGGS